MPNASGGLKIKHFVPKTTPASSTLNASTKRCRPRIPDDQRKRARQACESCRQCKDKCHGGIPCQKCARENTVCTLAASKRNATPEPVEHIRLTKAERAVYLEKVLNNVLGVAVLHDNELRIMAEVVPGSNAITNSEMVGDEREKLEYAGEASLLTFSRQLQQKLGNAVQPLSKHSSSATNVSTDSLVCSALSCFPPRHIAEHLVQVFFTYVQCNNFYVQDEWIKESLDTCFVKPSTLRDDDIPRIATLAMIIALGTQFSNMTPSTPGSVQDGMDITFEHLGNTLYHLVTGMLAELIKRPGFESVRACLLIAVYLFPIDLPGLAFSYLGLTLHMAIRIGLHRKVHNVSFSQNMREVHTRVWWTLYTFYQRARIFHGHPKMLSHLDVDVGRPRLVRQLEPSNGISNFRNQVALIDITIILEDVASEIALLRKARKAVHVANLLSMRRNLMGLIDELPDLQQHTHSGFNLHRLRLDMHVYLHYWHTRLFVGRPFLLSHLHAPTGDLDTSARPTLIGSSGREILAKDSVDAAVNIINLCQAIHDRIGLAKASYATEFTCCRAAMLVLIARRLTDGSDALFAALAQGLSLIQQMSAGHGQASSEARVIEALQCAISRLHPERGLDNASEESNTGGLDTDLPSDSRFKQWEQLWQQFDCPLGETTTFTEMEPNRIMSTPGDLNPPQFSVPSDIIGDVNFNDSYGTADPWTSLFHSQLDEFNLIPETDGI